MDTDLSLHFPQAPDWSLWIGSLGRGFIWLACGLLVLAALTAAFGGETREKGATRLFVAGAGCFFGAILCLGVLFATDQFQFFYVFSHSDKLAELRYKIAAIWSGQEGSFLLWACTSALFGILAIRKTGLYRRWFLVPYALFLGGLAGILSYESPFNLQLIQGKALVPPTGAGMAPSLMNYWVTIHPPTIFLGFGSLTVLFCWALSALINRNLVDWAPQVRPWAIISVTLLGLGLCMGGFWAYETLGWGGFWAWDPVENVSFVPWCLAVAFVHGLFVQVAKGQWKFGNAAFAGMAFLSFVYGTFMTRSGFLGDTSVHSFAEMNRSALWLLIGMLLAAFIAFFAIYFSRLSSAAKLEDKPQVVDDAPILSKKYAYGLSILLLTAFALTAGFGMSVPLVLSVAGKKPAVVEAGLYHQVFVWFFILTMIAMAIGPWLGWRKVRTKSTDAFWVIVSLTIGLLGIVVLWIKSPEYGVGLDSTATIAAPFGYKISALPWMATLIGLCLFAFLSNLWLGIDRIRKSRSSIGGLIMHLGVIVTMTGLIVSRGFERSEEFGVQDGKPAQALGYLVAYAGPTTNDFLDRNNKIKLDVSGPHEKFEATPGLYYIPRDTGDPSPMVWPYIHRHPFYDLYFSMGPMIFDATDPITFKVGEKKLFEKEKALLSYRKMTMQGTPGSVGVKFGAEMVFETPEGTVTAVPSLEVGKDGPIYNEAKLNDDLSIRLLRMDAATKSVTVQINYIHPLFPIQLFYKPMTVLVWSGAGIMALGGCIAAFYRRNRPKQAAEEPSVEVEAEPVPA